MSHKSPHELDTGMKLAADVHNLDGNLLFPAGTELSERQIEALMMWGVESVLIEGGQDDEEGIDLSQFSEGVVEQAQSAINDRYRLTKSSHPAIETIRRISILEAAKRVSSPNS